MGGALARRLVPGYTLYVWDLNKKAVDTFVALGARTVDTLAELGRQCEIVILCLPRSADVEKVVFGPEGLVEGLSAGKIVVDQTSGIPSQTAAFAERLARLGVALMDAPVAGGVPSALAGNVTIMTSGPDDVFGRVEQVLTAISPKVYRASQRVGDGQAVKLINNTMNAGYRLATLELAALGRRLGLSLRAMTSALNQGWARNFSSRQLLPAIVEKRSSADFALALMVKDLNQTLSLATEFEVPMPISNLARGLLQMGVNAKGEDARLDDVVPFMETVTRTRYSDVASGESADASVSRSPERNQTTGAIGRHPSSVDSAHHLLERHEVHVFSVERKLSDKLEQAGDGACDIIIHVGSGEADIVNELSRYVDAAQKSMTKKLVIDFTDRTPATVQELSSRLNERNIVLIDACVSGGPGGATVEPCAVLYSCSAGDLESIRKILGSICPNTIYCGQNGSAHAMRLIVNAIALCNRLVVYENAALGVKLGLSTDALSKIINNGSAWSGEAERILPTLSKSGSTTTVSLRQSVNELDLLVQLGFANGAPMFLANEVRAALRHQMNLVRQDASLDAMQSYYESMAGIRFGMRAT
jgi:3-hydroxyisobutyrate dehydrogenase